MFGKIILALSALAWASAQIPNLGFCPEYVPMANFDMKRFLGVWYETERYFQLSEVASRCVMTNYTRGIDGKYRVSNEVTNRFTGVKRILEGEIRSAASKAEEGKLQVKYTTIPLTPETKYSVLETDYKSYAVLWSCQGIGPVHAQNAWVMTRERIPPGEVLQKAYGVLDKYKIPKTFFVKTDQTDCAYSTPEETNESTRSAVASENVDGSETREEARIETSADQKESASGIPKTTAEPAKSQIVETVPERILKTAEAIKEVDGGVEEEVTIVEIKEDNNVENTKAAKSEKETEKTA